MSTLKRLREEKKLSQRTLADLCSLSRGRLRRLEEKGVQMATCSEIRRISKALGLDAAKVFQAEIGRPDGVFFKKAREPFCEVINYKSGCRLTSFFPSESGHFSGKIYLDAGRSFCSLPFTNGGWTFIQILLGRFRLDIDGHTYEAEEGDTLLFQSGLLSCIENPEPRESVALLLAVFEGKSACI